jgi:RNA polymerase sigma-70 factor (ECF subfamily)
MTSEGGPLREHADFQRLVMVHLDAGYNLARWLARDPQDAQDVLQDACLRAMKYVGSLHGDDGRSWFLTIVRRAFYDWLAHNRPALAMRADEIDLDGLADEADGPEQALLHKAERLALTEAVAALPLPFREVIVLRELEELSYKEIARIADVPIGTVMSRLSRARRLLQVSARLRAVSGVVPKEGP